MPMGIEPSVTVASEVTTGQQAGALTNDGVGGLTILRSRSDPHDIPRVTNDTTQTVKLLVRAPANTQANLVAPAVPRTSKSTAIAPATVAARSSMDLAVERRLAAEARSTGSRRAPTPPFRAYLVGPHADPVVAKKLEAAWSIRNEHRQAHGSTRRRLQQYDWTRRVEQLIPTPSGEGGEPGASDRGSRREDRDHMTAPSRWPWATSSCPRHVERAGAGPPGKVGRRAALGRACCNARAGASTSSR